MRDAATKVEMELVEVTPSVATAWLDQNTHNRKVRIAHVDRLARDMAAGRYIYTGDPVRFDKHGVLLDGQHRLMAIEKSGVPQTMLVMYGLSPEAQKYIDGGRKRSAADALALLGYSNTHIIALVARAMYAEGNGTVPFGGHAEATTAEICNIVENVHPQLSHYVMSTGSLPKGISMGGVSLCNYVGHYALDVPDLARQFVHIVKNGSDDTSCPARAYRERCINAYADGNPLDRRIAYYSAKKAFNWFLAGDHRRFSIARENVDIDGVDLEFYRRGPKRRKVKAA